MENRHYQTYVKIGLNILYFRKLKRLTQLQLAEMTNYSRNHIQQIETANAIPSIDAILDIALVLNVPVGRLFDNK